MPNIKQKYFYCIHLNYILNKWYNLINNKNKKEIEFFILIKNSIRTKTKQKGLKTKTKINLYLKQFNRFLNLWFVF